MEIDPVKATSDITVFLDTYGPWAVMAIAITAAVVVVWWLGKHMKTQVDGLAGQLDLANKVIHMKEGVIAGKDNDLLQLAEKRHEEFTRMIEETVSALNTAAETNQRLIVLMDRCDRNQKSQRVN